MAEVVGSALLSGFFSVLFHKLAVEEVKNFLRPKKVIKKLLKMLEVSLLSANRLLDDAEEKLIYDPRVEIWHNKLKDDVYKASELADKIETEVLRLKMEENQSASNITEMSTKLSGSNPLNAFDNYVEDELQEILCSLEHLLSQKDALGLVPAGTGRSNYSDVTHARRFRATPVADESAFCGREDIKETIIQNLRSADVRGDNIAFIPIIGAGGLGKTTLARIIYDHPDVEKHFPKARAWVTVSIEFDLPTISKEIIGNVSTSSRINGNEDQQELLFKLEDALKGKRFLLVLDNVWSEDHDKWHLLKSCFKSVECGSKIIVTTRSTRVASIAAPNQPFHFLQELPEEDCRRLFKKTVFSSDQDWDAHPDLYELGQKIVEKCKGLPLSVISVGGILRGDRDPKKWENVLKSSMWELPQPNSKNIIPSLWLSYRYLPSAIKPCFAYCSIFPNDYWFKKEVVVQLWMAEGFLENDTRKRGITMEEVGKQYFEVLISRSLFQRSNDSYRETFIMPSLVHDLARSVLEEFCFCLDGEKNLRDLSCKTRYFSYNMEIQDVKKFKGLSKAKRLHSFVGLRPSTQIGGSLKVLEELAMEGGCLRVLSLSSDYTMKSLPDSIGNLKHLRYLNLSGAGVEKLPDSVVTLYSLQTLLLSECRKLTQLPDSIGDLKHLKHLNLSGTGVEKLPDSVGTLYSLQTLLLSECRKLTQLPDSIGDLKHLKHLNFSGTGVEKLPDSVGTLYSLQTLLLSECRKLTQLPDSIGDLKHLRHLNFSGTGVEKLPDSVGTLYSLQTLLLSECRKLTQLPDSIGDLKHLRHLNFSGTGVEKLPDSVGTLYSLETLLLSECRKLTQLPDSIGDLKHLRHLNFSGTGVEKLPDSVGTLYSLEMLLLSECRNLNHLTSNMGSLINLHHLDTRETPLKEMPPHMCNLKKLQTLPDFVVGKCGSSITDLGALHDLNGELRVSGLQNVVDVLKGSLQDKENLSELVLEWEGQFDDSRLRDSRKEKTILDALQPHANLKKLFVSNYGGTSFPDWVGDSLFSKMETVHLNNCKDGLSLPALGRLPYLKKLKIRGFHSLETIDDGFYGNDSPFKSLEVLHFEDMPEWKKWSVIEVPCLKELKLKDCPKLVGGLPNCNTITTLSIHQCKNFDFPENCRYASLKTLRISNCDVGKSIPLDYFPKLNRFTLWNCQNFESFRFAEEPPVVLESLTYLDLKGLPKFVSFPEGGLPAPNLKDFYIQECKNLSSLPQQMHYFGSLEILEVYYPEIESFSVGLLPPNLKEFYISNCKNLTSLPQQMHKLGSLEILEVKNCPEIESLPEGALLPPSLKEFYISNCKNLRSLPQQMHNLRSLEILKVEDCPEIKSFPEGGRFPSNIKQLWFRETPHTYIGICKD